MNNYFFVRVSEDISDERWYNPSEIFMVVLYDEYDVDEYITRYDIIQTQFNENYFLRLRPDLISRYRDDELSIAYSEADKIEDMSDLMNHDFIEFLKIGSDLNV